MHRRRKSARRCGIRLGRCLRKCTLKIGWKALNSSCTKSHIIRGLRRILPVGLPKCLKIMLLRGLKLLLQCKTVWLSLPSLVLLLFRSPKNFLSFNSYSSSPSPSCTVQGQIHRRSDHLSRTYVSIAAHLKRDDSGHACYGSEHGDHALPKSLVWLADTSIRISTEQIKHSLRGQYHE